MLFLENTVNHHYDQQILIIWLLHFNHNLEKSISSSKWMAVFLHIFIRHTFYFYQSFNKHQADLIPFFSMSLTMYNKFCRSCNCLHFKAHQICAVLLSCHQSFLRFTYCICICIPDVLHYGTATSFSPLCIFIHTVHICQPIHLQPVISLKC